MSVDRHIIRTPLKQRYGAPPFSVLDARAGYWQDRKRWWLSHGIRSEIGRGEALIGMSKSNRTYMFGKKEYDVEQLQKNGILLPDDVVEEGISRGGSAKTFAIGDKAKWNESKTDTRAIPGGGTGKNSAWLHKKADGTTDAVKRGSDEDTRATGTSIFDTVLCELMYRWFIPEGGSIGDPFCGGSVRGIVASLMGHPYVGTELRPEQVQANRIQGLDILGNTDNPMPQWLVGDALTINGHETPQIEPFDFFFTCPPYGDLEVYSEDPRDISTMDANAFMDTYRQIIWRWVDLLKDNRFAAIVVGDYRDENGFYRNFVGQTVAAFEAAGAYLYNEAFLLTVAGSLPIRIHKQFANNRKLGKTHQNVLVFFKGDPSTIQDEFPYLDNPDSSSEDTEWL